MRHSALVLIGSMMVMALSWGREARSAAAAFGPLPAPSSNPQSPSKIALGKALFWDEQLSVTRTVACGTCHRPEAGGGDPRSTSTNPNAVHPGPDGQLGTEDDIIGSIGVPALAPDGSRSWTTSFGYRPQVTHRAARSVIDVAFRAMLFWDGRVTGTFDASHQPLEGALEVQALLPLLNPVEMGRPGAEQADLPLRILRAKPLALAENVPADLETWIAGRDYPSLFEEVFGDPHVSSERMAKAIASDERSLIGDAAPIDEALSGNENALTSAQLEGRAIFVQERCGNCHGLTPLAGVAPVFSNHGVRPPEEDIGRYGVTGNVADLGAMLMPTLRNVSLRGSMLHNGRQSSLADVVDFYARGGDHDADNKNPMVQPLSLGAEQRANLTAFLAAFTDPRVKSATGPFTRPTLFSESLRAPRIVGGDRAVGGLAPVIGAIEPATPGSRFTVTVEGGAAHAAATLVVSRGKDLGVADTPPKGDFTNVDFSLGDHGEAAIAFELPTNVSAESLTGRIYIENGSATRAFEVLVFGEAPTHIFYDGF